MHWLEGRLVFSASDLTDYLACTHLLNLEIAATRGELGRPSQEDELARSQDLERRDRFLASLAQQGRQVEHVVWSEAQPKLYPAAHERTLEAMRRGVEVIQSAVLFDGEWLANADFLLRVEGPSKLGAFHYEVADVRQASTAKSAAIIQMCAFAAQLECAQGRPPERIHVVLGDGSTEPHRLEDYSAYYRAVRQRFDVAVASAEPSYPDPVSRCVDCAWAARCDRQRRTDDHLSLVAGIRRDQVQRLVEAGLPTLEALAFAPPDKAVAGLSRSTFTRLRLQAVLQVRQRREGKISYEMLPLDPAGRGLAALPEPSPGDLFINVESSLTLEEEGLTYLFGVAWVEQGERRHQVFWAHNRAQEKQGYEALIDFVHERLSLEPSLHVFHYAPGELNALKRLMGTHASREAQLDQLLRGKIFVDLHQVVRQSMRVSEESYAISSLEPLFRTAGDWRSGRRDSSLLDYERWRECGDLSLLEAMEANNRDECLLKLQLRDWLEARRADAETLGGVPLPRPPMGDIDPPAKLLAALTRAEELSTRLLDDVPEVATQRSDDQQARWLLAQLLGWHRRESKSAWWAYFERLRMSEEDLIEDSEAIGGLSHEGLIGQTAQYEVHRYRFDGAQEHKIIPGGQVVDPSTGRSPGTLLQIDAHYGLLELRRQKNSSAPHPRALISAGPVGTEVLEAAIQRLAEWVLEHGMDAAGPFQAGIDLLRRRPPRVQGVNPGAAVSDGSVTPAERARWLAPRLESSYLPVQGPPGAGKTSTAARMIVDLVRAGRRVGICAYSHRAIVNVLDATCAHAEVSGVTLHAVQRAAEPDWHRSSMVKGAASNDVVERALAAETVDVVAGTPWLFAREGLTGVLDTLFVDESAQLSLANVLAIAGSARNLVLLGDPQQLTQPSQGIHPPGVDVSALGHVIGDAPTVDPERGLLLDTTWRLHPEICGFISQIAYGGQLRAHSSCAEQRIAPGDRFSGSGLRLAAVEHRGNRTFAPEEVRLVDGALRSLLGRAWTAPDGSERALTLDDVLVVAPYNAQVSRLLATLPAGARVGTVDRFQGQEGAVVLFSLTTSTAEDISHGLEFLLSLNRLNVAVSRARALAVLVCNPDLFAVTCRTPDQMRLVNAFCRFVELASAG